MAYDSDPVPAGIFSVDVFNHWLLALNIRTHTPKSSLLKTNKPARYCTSLTPSSLRLSCLLGFVSFAVRLLGKAVGVPGLFWWPLWWPQCSLSPWTCLWHFPVLTARFLITGFFWLLWHSCPPAFVFAVSFVTSFFLNARVFEILIWFQFYLTLNLSCSVFLVLRASLSPPCSFHTLLYTQICVEFRVKISFGWFLSGPVVKTVLWLQGAWVWS